MTKAKRAAHARCGCGFIPGYDAKSRTRATHQPAESSSYPVMIKRRRGGGVAAFVRAARAEFRRRCEPRSEARRIGDARVILEKAMTSCARRRQVLVDRTAT